MGVERRFRASGAWVLERPPDAIVGLGVPSHAWFLRDQPPDQDRTGFACSRRRLMAAVRGYGEGCPDPDGPAMYYFRRQSRSVRDAPSTVTVLNGEGGERIATR